MTTKPQVSILIVNWNGGQVFKNCLSSLAKIDYPNWDLIIVDNGSTDGSYKYKVANVKTTLIRNKFNLGFAPANNQGVLKAKAKYVLLLNNDTLVEKDFLSKMVERIEQEDSLGVIQPKIRIMDKPKYLDNAGSFLTKIGFLHHWGFMEKDSPEFNSERLVFSVKGACMLIRKAVIDKIGLFDPDFVSYFEESDFCWRVWLNGWKIIYFPGASIYHKLGFTIKRLDVLNINFHYYKNRIASLIKNLEIQNLVAILIIHLIISLGISSLFLVRGGFKNSSIILKAIYWNFVNLPKTLSKRKVIQSQRLISDKILFSQLAESVNWKKFISDFKRVEKDLT